MEITNEIIEKSVLLNEGTTSYILQYDDAIIYKIYKGAIRYINGIGVYGLNETETLNRLNYIVSMKEKVILTDLPSDILMFKEKPVGVTINYYKNSITLKDFLLQNGSNEYISIMKQQVINIVDELIKNGIVPTDPHLENFLVCFNDDGTFNLNMVDTDDQYISVYPDSKRDVWYKSEVNACYRVIDLSFEEIKKQKNEEVNNERSNSKKGE